jgi:hypothetical protein
MESVSLLNRGQTLPHITFRGKAGGLSSYQVCGDGCISPQSFEHHLPVSTIVEASAKNHTVGDVSSLVHLNGDVTANICT